MLLSNLLDEMTLSDHELKDDNDRDDAAVDGWNKLLMRDKVKIWWEDLYHRDIECRGRPVVEEDQEDQEEGEEEPQEAGQRRVEPIGRGQHQGGLKEEIKKMMELMLKPIQEKMETIDKAVDGINQRLTIVENQVKPMEYNEGFEYDAGNQFETGGSSFRGNEDADFSAADSLTALRKKAEEEAAKEKEDALEKKKAEDKKKAEEKKKAAEKEAAKKKAEEEAVKEKEAEEKRIADDIFAQPSQPMPGTPAITPIMKKKLKRWIERAKTPRPKRERKPSAAMKTPYLPK